MERLTNMHAFACQFMVVAIFAPGDLGDAALLFLGVLYASPEESKEISVAPVLRALLRERDHELEEKDRELDTSKKRIEN
ncbi:hypothetical protein ACE6H2_021926 [Prunus campanulata]